MEERGYADVQFEGPEPPLPRRGRRSGRSGRRIAAGVAAAVVVLAVGVAIGVLVHRGAGTAAVAAESATSAAAATSPPADATAPADNECSTFEQVYNTQVGPALKAPAGGASDVYWTAQADAFHALAGVLGAGTDPYSQTLAHDATAVEASDRQYDADGNGLAAINTFMADLDPFLKQCGLH